MCLLPRLSITRFPTTHSLSCDLRPLNLISLILSPPMPPLSGIREQTCIDCASGQRSRTPHPPGLRSLGRLPGRYAAYNGYRAMSRPYQPATTMKKQSRENCLVSQRLSPESSFRFSRNEYRDQPDNRTKQKRQGSPADKVTSVVRSNSANTYAQKNPKCNHFSYLHTISSRSSCRSSRYLQTGSKPSATFARMNLYPPFSFASGTSSTVPGNVITAPDFVGSIAHVSPVVHFVGNR